MRKVLGLAAVAVLVTIGAAACQPVEPAMTITAKAVDSRPGCGSVSTITGQVTSATTTRTVALQRTVSGKWIDWKQSPSSGQPPVLLTGTVGSGGEFSIGYQVPFQTTPVHIRVRTAGNGAFSSGLYVTPTEYDTGQCQ